MNKRLSGLNSKATNNELNRIHINTIANKFEAKANYVYRDGETLGTFPLGEASALREVGWELVSIHTARKFRN